MRGRIALLAALLLAAGCVSSTQPPRAARSAPAAAPEVRAPTCPPFARAVASHLERRVGVDNATALAAMALAAATGENLSAQDLTDTYARGETTCVARASVGGVVVLSGTFARVVACERTVRLGSSAAMDAIALARSGIPVHVRDVLSVRSTCVDVFVAADAL